MRKKSNNGYGVAYGKLPELDARIGNMSKLHSNPYKRYYVKALTAFSDGFRHIKEYFPNLAEARAFVAQSPERCLQITDEDLSDELSDRYRAIYEKIEQAKHKLGLDELGLKQITHEGVRGLFIPFGT